MSESLHKVAAPAPNPALVIAEVGVNHNGVLDTAIKLVELAVAAGADIAKFQSFKANEVVHPSAGLAPYQLFSNPAESSQLEMLRKLEFSRKDFVTVADICKSRQIEFMSTAFSPKEVDFLESIGQTRFKIPSGEITNIPLLRHVGKKRKPVILSTGMSNLQDVSLALDVLRNAGTDYSQITVLHCTSSYPAPFEDINLNAMVTIREELGVSVGFSDHSEGSTASLVAASLGACVIEKHITLDKKMQGPDHRTSMNPEEFVDFVKTVKLVSVLLGDPEKKMTPSEAENQPLARRSVYARVEIRPGELLSEENLICLRPAIGISPTEWDRLIGVKSKNHYKPNDIIR